jgi:hypothetical protein
MTTWKDAVRLATTQNITNLASPPATVDGVTLAANDRVLVKDQTTPTQNGIYVLSSGALIRSADTLEFEAVVRVSDGAINAHTEWALVTQGGITVGATPLSFGRLMSLPNVATVADLKSLFGTFTTGSVAEVAGYAAPGDGGGGTFTFDEPVITGALASTATVNGASPASPIVITTSAAHPFVDGQAVFVQGVAGNTAANGSWRIANATLTTFELVGSKGNGLYVSGGGAASSVTVTTSTAHGLLAGGRAVIERVTGTGGFSINGTWSPIGSTSPTTVTVPASTSGSYMSGGSLGDGGMSVPSTAVNGRWLRRRDTEAINPKWYGCPMNGLDDDYPGFRALLDSLPGYPNHVSTTIQLPPGRMWLSRSLRVNRPIALKGSGPVNRSPAGTTIEFAPGHGFVVDDYRTDPWGNSGGGSSFENFHLRSRQLTISNPVFGGLYTDTTRRPNTAYSLGYLAIPYNANPTRANTPKLFGVTTAGSTAGTPSAGTDPTGFAAASIGTAVPDGSVVWTCEALPRDYSSYATPGVPASGPKSYAVGDRVFKVGECRFYWECIVPGSTAGDGSTPFPEEPDYLNLTQTDGTITWELNIPAGFFCRTGSVAFKNLFIVGFTGGAIYIQGDGAVAPLNIADYGLISDVYIDACGLGIGFKGFDAQGWTVINCEALLNPNGVLGLGGDQRSLKDSTIGYGCYGFLDRSLGNTYMGCYHQGGGGPGFWADRTGSTFLGCRAESSYKNFVGVGNLFLSGNDASGTAGSGTTLLSSHGRHITAVDDSGAKTLSAGCPHKTGTPPTGSRARTTRRTLSRGGIKPPTMSGTSLVLQAPAGGPSATAPTTKPRRRAIPAPVQPRDLATGARTWDRSKEPSGAALGIVVSTSVRSPISRCVAADTSSATSSLRRAREHRVLGTAGSSPRRATVAESGQPIQRSMPVIHHGVTRAPTSSRPQTASQSPRKARSVSVFIRDPSLRDEAAPPRASQPPFQWAATRS